MMESFIRRDSKLTSQMSTPSMKMVPLAGSTRRKRATANDDLPARVEEPSVGHLPFRPNRKGPMENHVHPGAAAAPEGKMTGNSISDGGSAFPVQT